MTAATANRFVFSPERNHHAVAVVAERPFHRRQQTQALRHRQFRQPFRQS